MSSIYLTRLTASLSRHQGLLAAGAGTLAVRLAGMVASFLLGVLLARFLEPEGLGTYGVVIAAAAILAVAAQAGLTTVATREMAVAHQAEHWGRVRAVPAMAAQVALVAGAVALALAVAVAVWRSIGGAVQTELLWACVLIPLTAVGSVLTAILRGLDRVVLSQWLDTFLRPALVCLACILVVLLSGSLAPGQALALNAGAAAMVLVAAALHLRGAMPIQSRSVAADHPPGGWLRAGIPLAKVDLLKQVEANIGILVLGILAASAEAGLFRVALSAAVFVAVPLSVIQVVLTPTLARLHAASDGEELQRLLGASAGLMTSVTLFVLLAVAVAGEGLMRWVFGEAYGASWLPLMLLAGAQLLNAFMGCGWVLLAVANGERSLARAYAMSVPAGVVLSLVLGWSHGAVGVATAALAASLFHNLLVWRAVRRAYGLDCSALALLRRTDAAR